MPEKTSQTTSVGNQEVTRAYLGQLVIARTILKRRLADEKRQVASTEQELEEIDTAERIAKKMLALQSGQGSAEPAATDSGGG